MKKKLFAGLLLLVSFICLSHGVELEDKIKGDIRLACVGDSITYGMGIKEREKDCYPTQLDKMLSDRWEVQNFGSSGATCIDGIKQSYRKRGVYNKSLDFKPHVVVIKLGTNDAGRKTWRKHKGKFVDHYVELINTYKKLETNPKIYICYPAPTFECKSIPDTVISEQVIPLADEVAKKTGAEVIDVNKPLQGKRNLFADEVHPAKDGATILAKTVFAALTNK